MWRPTNRFHTNQRMRKHSSKFNIWIQNHSTPNPRRVQTDEGRSAVSCRRGWDECIHNSCYFFFPACFCKLNTMPVIREEAFYFFSFTTMCILYAYEIQDEFYTSGMSVSVLCVLLCIMTPVVSTSDKLFCFINVVCFSPDGHKQDRQLTEQ